MSSEIKPVQPVTPIDPDPQPKPQPEPEKKPGEKSDFEKELEKVIPLKDATSLANFPAGDYAPEFEGATKRPQVGEALTPDYFRGKVEIEIEGLSFSVKVQDIIRMEINNPSDCIHPGDFTRGELGGWPTVYVAVIQRGSRSVECLVLESCWGWSSGEDRIYCTAVTVT